MNKNILGILGLFIFIFGFTALSNENFLSAYNLQNLLKWSSLYAIMGIGVAFVIITGGIDLSIGSVIGLVASLMALMVKSEWDPVVAVLVLIALSLGIGLVHGLLVTKMKLQPFVVTLCGLLFYRGISRWATDNQSMGYGDTATLNSLFSGKTGHLAHSVCPRRFSSWWSWLCWPRFFSTEPSGGDICWPLATTRKAPGIAASGPTD